MFFATNVYPWTQLAKRNGQEWDLDRAMAETKQAGIRGWEQSFRKVEEIPSVLEAAKRHGLEMYSAYIPGAFHEPELASATSANVREIAHVLRRNGIRYIIVNPDPLPGGSLKTDAQLLVQSKALNELGKALASSGTRLLYHTHDPEMKSDGRELHHTLSHCDRKALGFCLDAHWVYRGASNDETILYEIIQRYADRIDLIHFRQSLNGVWCESIGPGDIDYPKLASLLSESGVKAIMVLELALQDETPATMTGAQANRDAARYLESILGQLSLDPAEGTNPPWRVYLYGAGAIAHQHGTAAAKLPGCQLFAADPSEDARDAFQNAFPNARLFKDAEEMLASSPAQDRDMVVLAVPPYLHLPAGLTAFRSGRHVLSEKPVVLSEAELSDLLAASHKAGRRFGECSIRFLGFDAVNRARDLIATNGIGKPYHARLVNRLPRSRPGIEYQPSSRWFLDKDKAGGGTMFDWGVYDLSTFFDVLRPVAARVHHAWIATPPTAVDPSAHPITVETHAGATMTLDLESGASVSFEYERACGFHGERQSILTVDGSTGGLSWDWTPSSTATVASVADFVGAEGNKAEPAYPPSTVTRSLDVDGKLVTHVETFTGFGYDRVYARPVLAMADLIAGRESTILSEARLKFNFGVLAAIFRVAAEGKPVDVRLEQ